ncbi:hypothetical protein AB0L53_34225 [Nonomuraea sp. NPDC052129]|uniref:hypothetical protein n=1 Tax=Nonomuraea sp. NPDC052129 TaxID=3154651 RepID=UPI003432A3D5
MTNRPGLERVGLLLTRAGHTLVRRSFTVRALEALEHVINGDEDAADAIVRYRLTFGQAEDLKRFIVNLGRLLDARMLDQILKESEQLHGEPGNRPT